MKPKKRKKFWEWYKKTVFGREEKKEALRAAVKKARGEKLSPEEEKLIKKYRIEHQLSLPVGIKGRLGLAHATWSYPGRHADVAEEIKKIAKRRKKIVINDVGYGELAIPEKGEKSWAPQFLDIKKALEEAGVEYQYNGYVYEPERAKITQESIPEKEREKHRFAALDIVNTVPAQQADVTVFLHVSEYLPPHETKAAFANLLSATKKGGYIITDIPLNTCPRNCQNTTRSSRRSGEKSTLSGKRKK